MRKFSKKGIAVAMSMALVVSALSFQPAEAAKKPKLSKSKLTITVGKTKKITVKNAEKKAKVTWKTSKKKVAKITKKSTKGKKAYAKIKGMKKGSAKITATYKLGKKKKKLTCKVKVKNASPTKKPDNTPVVTTPGGGDTTATPTQTTQGDGNTPTPPGGDTPTKEPTPTPTPAPPHGPNDYAYFNEGYTLGYSGKIVAYKDGKRMTLEEAGVDVYNKESDNIFGQKITSNAAWDQTTITLAQPPQYTTNDGVAHNIDSMLTNFEFMADPTAIDNTENDGKLYVYGTTEGIEYNNGVLATNGYHNHSLSIVSTEDMVNWTDEGTLDNLNLTNEKSTAKNKTICKWGTQAWAPSGLKIDGDGDGDDEYYLFYTNGGAVGYVMGDSPTGPWKDPLGKTLFSTNTPNCQNVKWCFDPAVLADDKGNAYVYFGGGVWNSGNEAAQHPETSVAHPKTGRVCKIKFKSGTGEVELDGEPQILDNYYFFEDSEINQINGKYFYSYCTNFNIPSSNKWVKNGSIACYVSSDPMNIAFDPEGADGDKYTDGDGVYHHYLGTILNNPSTLYGESYNNHHHMQTYKGHNYIFYHSTVLGNLLFRNNKQYRNLHVDEIGVDEETDAISITPTYEGASQIEDFKPYTNADGTARYINATTSAKSAGVTATRDDLQVDTKYNVNGSPMVLDEIDTGDWIMIKGVNFGENGLKSFGVEYEAGENPGRIELFIDDPTYETNKVASLDITEATQGYKFKTANTTQSVTGKHDVYFVFRGSDYKVATWIFNEKADAGAPDVERPDITPVPVETPNPDLKVGWNEEHTEYYLPITAKTVSSEGGAFADVNEMQGTATLTYNSQYPGVWFKIPSDVSEVFSAIEFTYKDVSQGNTAGGFGSAVNYVSTSYTQDHVVPGEGTGELFPIGEGEQTQRFDLNDLAEKGGYENVTFKNFKIYRNNAEDAMITITSVKLIK